MRSAGFRRFGFLIAAIGLASPAAAGEGLFCTDGAGTDLHLPLAGVPGLFPLGAELKAVGQVWATDTAVAGATPITVGQAFSADDRMLVDLLDAERNEIVAELRLFVTRENDDPVIAGTLRIAGLGAYAVNCS